MRKPKKLQPEPFDVGDFLRPTDTDLRSALSSLLHGNPDASLAPGLSLVEAPLPEPPIEIGEELSIEAKPILDPPLNIVVETNKDSAINSVKATKLIPAPKLLSPFKTAPPIDPTTTPALPAGLNLATAPQKRQFAVRPAHRAEDGHSRAEQQVYAHLWDNAAPFDEVSRLITLGFASMGKLTGLSESNARINLRSLIQKLAIDEHTTYDCAAGQGRTYRIYHPAEILRRRHEAGLRWVMRRTLAVVFVDPETKLPLFIKTGAKSGPGLNLASPLILSNLAREHLQQYGPADPETIALFIEACRRANPTLTAEQLAAAIHRQALLMKRMGPEQRIAFLIDAVPRDL